MYIYGSEQFSAAHPPLLQITLQKKRKLKTNCDLFCACLYLEKKFKAKSFKTQKVLKKKKNKKDEVRSDRYPFINYEILYNNNNKGKSQTGH